MLTELHAQYAKLYEDKARELSDVSAKCDGRILIDFAMLKCRVP